MSLFSWLAPKKRAKGPAPPPSSGLSRMDSTKPYQASREVAAGSNAQPANRKHERMARRELLYNVVREAMVRAGVLSSSYKFKVLSLDSRGRQFLVMVDLAQGAGSETTRLAEIEAAVAQMAKARHEILVTAVYWRSNDHVAVGNPLARPVPAASRPMPFEPSQPAPLGTSRAAVTETVDAFALPPTAVAESLSQPAELLAAPDRGTAAFDPLHPDEVAAFQQALAAASRPAPLAAASRPAPLTTPAAARPQPVAAIPPIATVPQRAATTAHVHASAVPPQAVARGFDGSAKAGPQSYTLLTGFEDTEMPQDVPAATALSATQYGELR